MNLGSEYIIYDARLSKSSWPVPTVRLYILRGNQLIAFCFTRDLDFSLSDDGKFEYLSFLYHVRQNMVPLVSLSLNDAQRGIKDSFFEMALTLAGTIQLTIRINACLLIPFHAGIEGGQKCASEILYHLLTAVQPSATTVFLRMRDRFLGYYSDVYRYESPSSSKHSLL